MDFTVLLTDQGNLLFGACARHACRERPSKSPPMKHFASCAVARRSEAQAVSVRIGVVAGGLLCKEVLRCPLGSLRAMADEESASEATLRERPQRR